jgi:hypothetical protein
MEIPQPWQIASFQLGFEILMDTNKDPNFSQTTIRKAEGGKGEYRLNSFPSLIPTLFLYSSLPTSEFKLQPFFNHYF